MEDSKGGCAPFRGGLGVPPIPMAIGTPRAGGWGKDV